MVNILCSDRHIIIIRSSKYTVFLYFLFLSIFKTDNNLKNIIMAYYHLHSMSIFLHYQIRVSWAHARVLAFEYKSAFSVPHVHMLIVFQKLVHN